VLITGLFLGLISSPKYFLFFIDAMQDNFTAFSVKIFEKHREIMTNLNRVENTADKILKQLGKYLHHFKRDLVKKAHVL
jgi:hypothetical protein